MNSILRALILALWLSLPGAGAAEYMVAAANPHAARAGIEMLRAGGSALDAAIAVQMVLNLVEPQSSGIGGGAFLLHWDAADRQVTAHDGRETAPAAARPDRFLRPDGTPMTLPDAIDSARSIGVPGVLRMLELAHARRGQLPWRRLFEPAIRLAEKGFSVSPRLHRLIAAPPLLQRHAAARVYFYLPASRALPAAYFLRIAFDAVLRRVADERGLALPGKHRARHHGLTVAIHPPPRRSHRAGPCRPRAPSSARRCDGSYRTRGSAHAASSGRSRCSRYAACREPPIERQRPGSSGACHLLPKAGRLAYAIATRYVAIRDSSAFPRPC